MKTLCISTSFMICRCFPIYFAESYTVVACPSTLERKPSCWIYSDLVYGYQIFTTVVGTHYMSHETRSPRTTWSKQGFLSASKPSMVLVLSFGCIWLSLLFASISARTVSLLLGESINSLCALAIAFSPPLIFFCPLVVVVIWFAFWVLFDTSFLFRNLMIYYFSKLKLLLLLLKFRLMFN